MIWDSDKKEWIQQLEDTGLSNSQASAIINIFADAIEELESDISVDSLQSELDDLRETVEKLQPGDSSAAEREPSEN